MKHFTLFLLIIAIVLTNSCKKPDKVQYLNKEFLSYFAFPKGSWWVYQDNKNGVRDSIYIGDYNINIVESKKELGTREILSFYSNSIYGQKLGKALPDYLGFYYYESYGKSGYGYPRFVYPPKYDKYINISYKFSMKQHFDSFQVNNVWYKDVYQTECLDSIRNGIKNEFYAKNVGVIKGIHYGGVEMELVKYLHAK